MAAGSKPCGVAACTSAADAITARVRDGGRVLKKGPFVRSKEQMCACELLDCANEAETIEAAASHPMARGAMED